MTLHTFRQALAEEAGRELGRALGMSPAFVLFAAIAFAPIAIDAWLERRERTAKDCAQNDSEPPAETSTRTA